MNSLVNFGVGFLNCIADYYSKEFKDSKYLEKIYSDTLKGDKVDVIFDNSFDMNDITGFLIISNHISVFDPSSVKKLVNCKVVCGASLPCDTYEESIDKYDSIPFNYLKPGSSSFIKAKIIELTSKGDNVLLFPEGNISNDGKVLNFFQGGFKTAYENNIPILTIKLNFIDKDGNIEHKSSNVYIDSVINILDIPVEKIRILLKTMKIVKPSDYPTFDSFYETIYDSYKNTDESHI